ncbi:MAG: PhnD/SsuA/transferrin family substrate-binding protein [Lachnospiraceae bacterium]|jgi:NitT/TauT family transport system substrate-binding protein|nr:PhnD/SsuA/transferrin family substrate-binding protein [Lachnospiraceae bacterium]
MKRLISILTVIAMSTMLLAGCASEKKEDTSNKETKTEAVDVNVTALKGPTAMGMVQMMDQVDQGKIKSENYKFTISAAVDEVTPKIAKGTTDIAAVPANLASVLYNNTKKSVEVLAVNTLGVLYIVENGDTVKSVADLKGKTIFAAGKGATPEYALDYILKGNGLDPEKDVNIQWKSEHAECVAALAKTKGAIAMLPEPFVTTATIKNSSFKTVLDLTKEWNAVEKKNGQNGAMLTGVVIVRKAFLKEHPEAVADFLKKYKASVDYVNGNVAEAAKLVGAKDIVPEAVAKKAIPNCNIVCITGDEMKEKLSGYLTVLKDQNPKAIGGAMPADDFYYIGK